MKEGQARIADRYHEFDRKLELFLEVAKYHETVLDERKASELRQGILTASKTAATLAAAYAKSEAASATKIAEAAAEAPPTVAGTSTDATSTARAALKAAAASAAKTFSYLAAAAEATAKLAEASKEREEFLLTKKLEDLGFDLAEQQLAYELELEYQGMIDLFYEFATLAHQVQQASEEVRTVMALGDRLQLEREIFRKRAATVVQGYRSNDLTFRTFRNEALEQYRTLYDLASRYTYLAAKSYDYETGLLGTDEGQKVINRIVSSRALGDLANGQPQATVSTLGDAGLAGTMAQLQADWSVAEGRLGINNPDESGTLIEHGRNLVGLPLAGGDHAFSASNFATKIYSAGMVLEGYVGMDPYAEFIPGAGEPDTNDPNALSATPYLYLIPIGIDKMLAPPLGDTGVVRSWMVQDQALPLPYNLGANAFSTTQFFDANGTLTEQPWILHKHQAFRPVDDPVFFYSGLRDEFDSARLVGRSVWNTQWKLVIPAYALLNDEQEGLNRFAATVSDIKLFLRTYSHSGN